MANSRLAAHVWCGLDSAQEQRNKPSQAVLVHGVNACQVSDAEKEQAGSDSNRAVLLSGSVDLLLCAFGFFNLAGNVIAGGLQHKFSFQVFSNCRRMVLRATHNAACSPVFA